VVAGVYAAGMLKGRLDEHHRLGFRVPFLFATVASIVQPLIGHVLGLRVAGTQPGKLAAFELATTTESPSPLRIGGLLINGHVRFALDIPWIGSLIARNSFTKGVQGMDTIPVNDRPPVNITHIAFQSMVALGTLLALVVVLFWFAKWRGRDLTTNIWFLRFAVIAGPLAIIALECGWIATEVGRQPWTVWQVLRTNDAASTSTGLWWSYAVAFVVYIGMTIGAFIVLRGMARRWREGETDLPTPYGPEAAIT
ncbi:MAG: cytochrome ubiquinol oxidase subunit, partial [Aeromicrobium sp.]|nr:cytochrome ubiquinol oxidase subunit [Aeromicrobium sp.]